MPEGAIQREIGQDLLGERYEGSPFAGLPVPPAPPDLLRLIARKTGRMLREDEWTEIERLRAFFGITGVGNDPKLATWRAGEPVKRTAPAVVTEVEAPTPRGRRVEALPDYDPSDLGD